jgi:hypothetical protein
MPSPQYQRNQASVRALKHHGLFDFCFRRGLPSKRVLRHKTLEKKSSFPLTDARSVNEGLLRNLPRLRKRFFFCCCVVREQDFGELSRAAETPVLPCSQTSRIFTSGSKSRLINWRRNRPRQYPYLHVDIRFSPFQSEIRKETFRHP